MQTAPLRIDSHHHFWRYSAAEYGWIDDSMRALRRDFLPEHLRAEIERSGVRGAVSVQARQSIEETKFLLDFADQHDFLLGVVGWAPLVDPGVERIIEKLAARKKLHGLRHVVQGEPDNRFILRDDFNAGVAKLSQFGLVYDILIYERHLPYAIQFVDRHPKQRFVLDHIAKPRIKDNALSPWRENLRELAKRQNVYCKLSGVATEADYRNWTEAQIHPYIETALEAFGARRMMFGSDWPVCLAATTYGDWLGIVTRAIRRLSETEQARVLGETAVEAYGLEIKKR
jgi:L-fuconolactonase